MARPRPAAALLLALLCVLGGCRAAVNLQSGGSTAAAGAAADTRVPCSQLPELQPRAGKVAILGSCR